MKKIFLIIFLGVLIFPSVGLAGTYTACEDNSPKNGKCDTGEPFSNIYYDGLVPCGKKVCKFNPDVPGTAPPCDGKKGAAYLDCQMKGKTEGQTLETFCVPPVGIDMVGGTLPGTSIDVGVQCSLCHTFVMIDGIIDFILFELVPPLAVFMLVLAGGMYIWAHLGEAEVLPEGGKGGPKMMGQAKKIINSIIVGLLIVYSGWLIVSYFFQVIGISDFEAYVGLKGGWFIINCPIALP